MIALVLMLVAQTTSEPDSGPQPALTATLTAEVPRAVASVTLAQLLDAAEKSNLDRRITMAQRERSEAEVRAAWFALLPSITAQAAWVHNQYESVIPAGTFGPEPITLVAQDQLELALRVEVPIIDASRWMRTTTAEALRDGAIARAELTLDIVRRAVTSSWYQYAGALALKGSALRSVQAAQAQLKLQEIRERAGAATELELLRARAEVERNKQSIADADRLIAVLRRSLRTLTGVDPGDAAKLPAEDLRAPERLEELEARVDQLPAVRAAEQDVVAAEALKTTVQLALVPSVNAQFTERVTNGAGFTGQASSFNFGLNLLWRLDLPAFQAVSAQSAQVAVASLAVEKARLAAQDQINTDWQTLQAALSKVQSVRAQVDAAQRARDVAATRYQAGASTQIEVIQADRDLFGAEVLQIQAQSDLASARVALRLSAGLPLQ